MMKFHVTSNSALASFRKEPFWVHLTTSTHLYLIEPSSGEKWPAPCMLDFPFTVHRYGRYIYTTHRSGSWSIFQSVRIARIYRPGKSKPSLHSPLPCRTLDPCRSINYRSTESDRESDTVLYMYVYQRFGLSTHCIEMATTQAQQFQKLYSGL